MPRLVFNDVNKFRKWIDKRATPKKYEVEISNESEVLLWPRVSTKNLNSAIMEFAVFKNAQNFVKELEDEGFDVFEPHAIEWDVTKAVGIRVKKTKTESKP